MRIDLAMLTVERDGENYAARTLESLFEVSAARDVTVHVFLGGRGDGHMGAYLDHARVRVHRPTEQDLRQMESHDLAGQGRVTYRLVVNYHRALCLAPTAPDAPLLVFEDDLVFAPQFWDRLEAALGEARRHGPEAVVTAYSTREADPTPPDRAIAPYPDPRGFYGTQCLAYGPAVRVPLRDYFLEHGVRRNEEPADRLVRSYAVARGVTIWQTYRSLVQHVGRRSSGVFTHWHTSPTFGLPWRS